jgi:hypothetical protein
MVLLPSIAQGIEFSETRRTAWRGLDRIIAPRAPLRVAPAELQQSRKYLVQGDIVGIPDDRQRWLRIEYITPAQVSITGWIAQSEASPLNRW